MARVRYGTSADELRAACADASADRPLAAVFCHADIVGALMNDGFAASAGLAADAFPPPPTLVRAATAGALPSLSASFLPEDGGHPVWALAPALTLALQP